MSIYWMVTSASILYLDVYAASWQLSSTQASVQQLTELIS